MLLISPTRSSRNWIIPVHRAHIDGVYSPAHILQLGASVDEIVNMAATVIDAQETKIESENDYTN